MVRFFSYICIGWLVLCSGVKAEEQIPTNELIAQGLQVRSEDPARMAIVITELEARSLSSTETYYLTFFQGYSEALQGNFDGAEVTLEPLFEQPIPHDLKVLVTNTLVNVYSARGNWLKGLETIDVLTQLIAGAEKTSEDYQNALAVKAIFYNQIEQYKLGLTHATELFGLADNTRRRCVATILMIDALNKLNLPLSPNTLLTDSKAECSGFPMLSAFATAVRAERHLVDGALDMVVAILQPKIAEFEAADYPPLIIDANYVLANAYWQLEQKNQAVALLSRLTDFDIVDVNKARLSSAYQLLADIRRAEGDLNAAIELMDKHAELRHSYLNNVTSKLMAYQLAQQQITEKENEIMLLSSQNELLETKEKLLAANVENDRLFISLLCFALLVLCMFMYRTRRNHTRLKQLAEYDALTGVFNRGHFTQLAGTALEYAQDSKQAVSMVLFDLDLFKKINDTYGHACGDWALKQVAEACQQVARHNDVFARIGGEEFCILLLGCDCDVAMDVAEKCRVAIEQIDTKPSGYNFTIRASFGVSDNQLSGYKLGRMLADADEALYCAKSSGRNTVSLYDPGAEETALLRPDGSPVT
ncbi:diguanylate cyclase [Neiella marina]|uniref:diguanylate cyclase n=1 Tax=Neiella holothuriorum TaxID=2870530 RepID=A0ABS7EBX8_9GAMM|nr:GGDEF domain-containing protein [Neiella holothuriorum]MBW8189829.1 diguanylate cyclase [Neiella holothuriorum]